MGGKMDGSRVERFSRLSRALWVHPHEGQAQTLETVCAVRSVESRLDEVLRRSLKVLYHQALDQSYSSIAVRELYSNEILSAFYQLSIHQRFVLMALHGLNLSYRELMDCSGLSPDELESIAWSARVQLSGLNRVPPAAMRSSPYCLEYNPKRPWTQMLMDDEFKPAMEKVSLQKHVLSCSDCARVLHAGQEIYYSADTKMIQLEELLSAEEWSVSLREILKENPHQKIRREIRIKNGFKRVGLGVGGVLLFVGMIELIVSRWR
jgi:hypothetical protein